MDNFYEEPNNATKYRRFFKGNTALRFNEEEETYYKKTNTFFELLNNYRKDENHVETRVFNDIIQSYQTPEQLDQIWNAIKKLQHHHPEYRLKIEFDNQELFSDYPSTWEEVVTFYYSCSINKSAAIKIVG